MEREAAIRTIKENWREILPKIGISPAKQKMHGETSYICPFCGHGKGGDGLTFNPKSKGGTGLKCFGCDFSGDVISLYMKITGMDFNTAIQTLAGTVGLYIDPPAGRYQKGDDQETGPDYVSQYRDYQRNIHDPAAVAYLEKRGISISTAEAYGIGYSPEWANPKARAEGKNPPASPRLIIPAGQGYVARDIRADIPERAKPYAKQNAGKVSIFNEQVLYSPDVRAVFVVEGAFDALSVIEAGSAAVALNSTANKGKLLELVKKKKPSAPLLLALDNDGPGKRAAQELADELKRANIPFMPVNISGTYKDPNEALTADRGAFFARVRNAESGATKPDNISFYMAQIMAGEIARFKEDKKPTGFSNLDAEIGGLYPGLYVLAAISSLGKTTFAAQLADQLAARGNDVVFFSMEQSRLELVCKSLARRTAQLNPEAALDSLTIRQGITTPTLREAAARYVREVGDRVSIVEGNFTCNVPFIGQYLRGYVQKNGARPVVIIDYLQILQGASKAPQAIKERVDEAVTELKRLSREMNLTILVISSVNRTNYMAPIDFESLKESGGIEYTADVVWGLQLQVLHDDIFTHEKQIAEKREKIRQAKRETPRRLELVCLKNRYGISSFTCGFEYYPKWDLFIPEAAASKYGEITI